MCISSRGEVRREEPLGGGEANKLRQEHAKRQKQSRRSAWTQGPAWGIIGDPQLRPVTRVSSGCWHYMRMCYSKDCTQTSASIKSHQRCHNTVPGMKGDKADNKVSTVGCSLMFPFVAAPECWTQRANCQSVGMRHPQLMESFRWTLNSSPYFVTILVFLLLGLQKERGREGAKDEKGGCP